MQELKKILVNAPANATLMDTDRGNYNYMYVDDSVTEGQHILMCANDSCADIEFSDGSIRSIADIKRIVELSEKLNILLNLHDNEVFVKEPWETTFEEVRALLSDTE